MSSIKDRLKAKLNAKLNDKLDKQPANPNEAKKSYPNYPLCIGMITTNSTLTYCTSYDGEFTSLGWIFNHFPSVKTAFTKDSWIIEQEKDMSYGKEYIVKLKNSKDYVLMIPHYEMDCFKTGCDNNWN
jgi:hypothetical protein